RGDDQVGGVGDLRRNHELGIGLHDDLDPRGTRGRREAVFGIGHHHPHDIHTLLAQHVQGCHAEMPGADEGNPHGGSIRDREAAAPVDNTSEAAVTPSAEGPAGYQQGGTRAARRYAGPQASANGEDCSTDLAASGLCARAAYRDDRYPSTACARNMPALRTPKNAVTASIMTIIPRPS